MIFKGKLELRPCKVNLIVFLSIELDGYILDNLLSLSFSMQANKGVYALLLGSGISRSAGIPTGWDIVVDLIKKLAAVHGELELSSPEKWYIDKYGKSPNYSEILALVAKTQAERQHLLEKYFEPTDQEKTDGIKSPTTAHREIAKLVKKEYIKVIITTNFDRLLELALQDEGIVPTVILNEDSAKGAVPLVHSSCTILKVHGDYKDTRIKNTDDELQSYGMGVDKLLNQIFDEFGLVICGWSAEWDLALRNALYRRVNRRYPIYWTGLKDLNGSAKDLYNFLDASFVVIDGADSFFSHLSEKVMAIEDEELVNPMSVKSAVALVKKLVPHQENKIKLYDLLSREVKQIININELLTQDNPYPNEASFSAQLKKYENAIHLCAHLYANGCYFDTVPNECWCQMLGNLANAVKTSGGYSVWTEMVHYPALIIYYVAGIACLVSNNYDNLYNITHKVNINQLSHDSKKAFDGLNPVSVFETAYSAGEYFGKPRHKTPSHDYILDVVKGFFDDLILMDENYQYAFDSFEYINGLLYASAHNSADEQYFWAPVGRFYWSRSSRYYSENASFYENNLLIDYEAMLKSGFFNKDASYLNSTRERYNDFIKKMPPR